MKSLTRALVAGSLPLSLTFGAHSASAATDNFCNFSDVGPFQLNGNAAQSGAGVNTVLRVTPNLVNQVGSAFLKTAVPFPPGTSFHSYIRAKFSPNASGADGISFILQNSIAAATALGSNGGGIGYGGVLPSVEVEFDTFLNPGWDAIANHIALMKNGDVTTHLASAPFALTSAQGFSTWIDFDGASKQIRVYASLGTIKPAAPLFPAQTIDIATIIGGTAYVGFTSGTSAVSNNHDIIEWEFSTDGVPCKCEGDPACGGPTPACSATKEICVQCSATNTTACTGQTPACDVPSGTCVQCLSNANCAGDTPICDLATKTCVPCKADADCVSFPGTPACALQGPQQGQCVECTVDAQCGGGTPKCDPNTNTCVSCLTSADCGGFTPVCNPNGHVCFPCQSDAECSGGTPACQPSGACGQCSSTNTSQCMPPMQLCDIPTGTCVNCESNQDCSGQKPVCILVSHLCGPCKNDMDCNQSPDGPACSMGGVNQGACVPCVNDSTCADPTPLCDVPSNQCVACLSNQDCAGMTPACDLMSHTCVGCVDDSTCDGPTPVCEGPTHTCVPCQNDYSPNNPPPMSCPTPDKPACEKMGPLAGHCEQCDSTNTTACTPKTPVCIPVQDLCGCEKDTDCPLDQYCDNTKVSTGTCEPGCHVVNGMDHCAPGEKCSTQDGTVGVCEPSGSGSSGSGGAGSGGGAPSGSGSMSGGQGGHGNGSGGAGLGDGIIGEGGGCSCSVVGDGEDTALALWACAALGAVIAGRRKRRR